MKSYTDLEQSKKLAEILPLESADMYYIAKPDSTNSNMIPSDICIHRKTYLDGQAYGEFCAWSLAALFGVLPEKYIELIKEGGMYRIIIKDSYMTCLFENPVDACCELIVKLHELKVL